MEKAPIKKFAVEARRKLIADVTFQLERYGITEKGIVEPQTSTDKELVFDLGNGNVQTIRGVRAVNQYRNLAAHVRGFYTTDEPKKELEQFIEEIAYTWFNRLIAIRFMEVNRYLPVRVLSSEITGQKLPDLVKAPFSGDLEFTDAEKQRIFDLQDANKEDDLFRFLFFKQCNDLSRILPRLFENLDGSNSFSELLITLSFNDPNGVVYRLVNEVDERWFDIHATDEDGKPMGQVQILGWMYQYYNTEPKDKVFADLKKNIKISKQNIPAATQLFTPDWIVRYMVENSLGRLWVEGHPDFDKSDWKYYLDEAPQEPQVEQQLKDIRAQYAKMEPEQLKVIDPCMGSGHILCYLFDVLMQIYLDNGYSKREAVRSILENNLFGLDIDKRAAQFAYFSVMMKAREYDSGFLSRKNADGTPNIPQPCVYEIQESQPVTGQKKEKEEETEKKEREKQEKAFRQIFVDGETDHWTMFCYLQNLFADAKEYGSILQPTALDYTGFLTAWKTVIRQNAKEQGLMMWYLAADRFIPAIVELASVLCQKYDAVVTNPPYMGASGMGAKLANFVKEHYPDTKSDMSTVCMERTLKMCNPNGYMAMINIPVWMFISSYEKLRNNILAENTIVSMVHPGRGIFGSDFGTTSFVIEKKHISDYLGHYRRLFDKQGDVESINVREKQFFEERGKFFAKQDSYSKIPGSPIVYWASAQLQETFAKNRLLGEMALPRQGLITGDNDRFLRLWHEVNIKEESLYEKDNTKWKPINKGGNFRRWYGNQEYVVNWENDGFEINNFKDEKGKLRSRPQNLAYNFRKSISWSLITSGGFSARFYPDTFMFNVAGISCFPQNNFFYILALLNSCVASAITKMLNPTINMNAGDIARIPVSICSEEEVDEMAKESIEESKADWDAFETSWDFKRHPLV